MDYLSDRSAKALFILWHGRVFDESDKSASTEGVREFTQLITGDHDWIVSLLPVRDGLILAYKQ